MLSLNSRNETWSDIDRLRVDRNREVDFFSEQLVHADSNVFIYGPRGVGKTFLSKLICQHIQAKNSHALPFFVSLFDIFITSTKESAPHIKAQILLQLVAAAWTNLIKKSYSELIKGAELKGRDILANSVEERYYQIYSALRLSFLKRTFQRETKAGISAIAKGELGETTTVEQQNSDLLPFEYFAFLEEFQSELKKNHGITKLIAICDEANLLPLEMQSALIKENIPIFRDKGLQFLFVGCGAPDELSLAAEECFEVIEELNGIPENFIQEFYQKRSGIGKLSIEKNASTLLHKTTEGNPRQLLMVLSELITTKVLENHNINHVTLSPALKRFEERRVKWLRP
jgi:hypothetical protein